MTEMQRSNWGVEGSLGDHINIFAVPPVNIPLLKCNTKNK